MYLAGKQVLVIGLGQTGIATVRFLGARGVRIAVTDEKPLSAWQPALTGLADGPAEPRAVPYGPEAVEGVDLVVPSPGVYPTNPLLREALCRGIPVVSELELAFRFLRTPVVAITGTNGKTTVTTLIGELLAAAGRKVFVGGNIGAPLIGYVNGPQEADWAVVEVSSFQLQWAGTFRPRIALLLNVTSDHVDYHGSFAEYRRVKEGIFARQTPEDLAILNADEEATRALCARLAPRVECFSASQAVATGMCLAGGGGSLLRIAASGARETYPLAMIRIPGRHNIENVMAAILAARGCGCTPAEIIRTVEGFRGLAHRIEYVAEKDGIRFYDDSKGTNVGAVARAIESFPQPVVLLMGGRDKDGDFGTLAPLVRSRVRTLILFGEAREKIHRRIGDLVPTGMAATMKEALALACAAAVPGDVVLLSPGCASFDEFTDYKHRGRVFQELVRLQR
jgi:UDP-N-acetylmuramoylalanine--D-glutamate ligase